MNPSGDQTTKAGLDASDPVGLSLKSTVHDLVMGDVATAPAATDYRPRAPFYPPYVTNPPMGPMQYPGSGLAGAVVPNVFHPKIESIGDLVRSHAEISSATLDFEYISDLNAIMHVGKCTECVRFGHHILVLENRAKYLRASSAHSDSITIPLHMSIEKLTKDARVASESVTSLCT
jgi:hypothetical protein